MPPELAHYTITGAQDWPMFKEMLSGMRILAFLLWGTVATGGGLMWRDLKNRIASQRGEDRTHCTGCKSSLNNEFNYVWEAIDCVAPRRPDAQERVVAAKRRLEDESK